VVIASQTSNTLLHIPTCTVAALIYVFCQYAHPGTGKTVSQLQHYGTTADNICCHFGGIHGLITLDGSVVHSLWQYLPSMTNLHLLTFFITQHSDYHPGSLVISSDIIQSFSEHSVCLSASKLSLFLIYAFNIC
jgi:hypothetical protein